METTVTNDNRRQLRTLVRGAYDVQQLRMEMGNRIVANFKAKLGQKPGAKEETMDAEAREILATLRESYHKLTDGLNSFPRKSGFEGDEVISSYTELCLVSQFLELKKQEKQHFCRMGQVVTDFPIYNQFLKGVVGIGSAMAGVIISEIDISRAKYVSSIWKYAGLDVAPDGKGRTNHAEHLIDVEYTNKKGELATKKSITYNPFLKTKLVGVLATSFLRCASPYRTVYDNYKHRLESHPAWIEKTPGHRNRASLRYMVKMFLADLYREWRTLEGLPVNTSYDEGKLGHEHAA